MNTPPETDEMPWENGVAWSPPGVSATPRDTHVRLPAPPCFSFSITKRKCACVVQWPTFFGGAICPAAALSGPLVLRPTPLGAHTHTHIRASIPLQRTSETSANTHTRAWTCTLPPIHLALGQSYPFFFCGAEVDLMLWAQAVITSDTPASGLRNSGYSPKKTKKKNNHLFPETAKGPISRFQKQRRAHLSANQIKRIAGFCSVKFTCSWDKQNGSTRFYSGSNTS